MSSEESGKLTARAEVVERRARRRQVGEGPILDWRESELAS